MGRKFFFAAGLSALLISACGKNEVSHGASKAAVNTPSLDADGLRAVRESEARRARAALPMEMKADGLQMANVEMTRQENEIVITANLVNGSDKQVGGINLKATYFDSDGIILGGYNTVHLFQPEVEPGAREKVVVIAPILGGESDKTTRVEIDILNIVVPGQSTGRWRALDSTDSAHAGADQ